MQLVMARVMVYRKEFSLHRDQLSRSIVPYVNAARAVITDTSHLVVIFVAVLVVVDLLGAVVWIYLKRSSSDMCVIPKTDWITQLLSTSFRQRYVRYKAIRGVKSINFGAPEQLKMLGFLCYGLGPSIVVTQSL